MGELVSKIGKVHHEFGVFKLKDILIKNDAGDWGFDPDENAVRVIRSTNFTNEGKLNLEDVAFRTLKPHKLKDKKLYEGELLIERSGGSDNQPVGRVGLITGSIVEETSAFANFIQRISINNDIIDSQFLFYCLQQMYEMGITASMQYQTTGIRNLDWKLYIKTILPKPRKPEQIAIAAILFKMDEAIEATQNSIKAAEKLKKALMQNLLMGKLRPDGIWRKEDEFQMTKIGLIPKEWKIKTVKEISTLVTDGEHTTPERSESGFYLLSARNIKNSYLDLSNVDYVKEEELRKIQKRCNPQSGDIIISCSGTIGNVCMVPEGLDAGMVRSAALIKLKKDEIEPEFAELVFQSFSLQNQMKVSVASSVQGNIFQGAIRKLKIPYPPDREERTQITQKIKGFSALIIEKQTKIQNLQRLKKSLMQNLLTGKVRLPEVLIKQLNNG